MAILMKNDYKSCFNMPYFRSIDIECDRAINKVIRCDEWERAINSIAFYLSEIEFIDIKPNKTGRKLNVKFRYRKRIVRASVSLYEGQLKTRSLNGLMYEILPKMFKYDLISMYGVKSKSKKFKNQTSVFAAFHDSVYEKFRQETRTGAMWQSYIQWRYVKAISSALLRKPGNTKILLNHVLNNINSREITNVHNSHQYKRAMVGFRQMTSAAFKYGASIDRLEEILKEELVRCTMSI
jgi:hypothetical protein